MKIRQDWDKRLGVVNWCVDAGQIGGRRLRRRFPTQEQAEAWVQEIESIRAVEGQKTMELWARMTENERGSLVRALELLRSEFSPVNFEKIARAYLIYVLPGGGNKTIPEAIDAFMLRKLRGNKKESYRVRLKRDLLAFSRDFPQKKVSQISQQMIENWVFEGDDWKPITQRNRLRDLHQLFAYCVKQKWCTYNPVADIERPTVVIDTPAVFTPEEADWIMRKAESNPEWELVPFLALGLFAGLRTCELFNLRFEDIRFQRQLIILSAHQTKTRTRRVVDNLAPNLMAWLLPHVNCVGPICPQETTVEWRLPLLVKAIQTEHPEFIWKRNGMRHSSASYHLAKGRNENTTALMHGHRPEMLFRYYRELVCAEESEQYYGIFPSVTP
jgi:integrase